MGKKSSSRKPVDNKKRLAKYRVMPDFFDCVMCQNEGSIKIEINKPKREATLTCSICSVTWKTITKSFTEPVDVYTEWTDEMVSELQREK